MISKNLFNKKKNKKKKIIFLQFYNSINFINL